VNAKADFALTMYAAKAHAPAIASYAMPRDRKEHVLLLKLFAQETAMFATLFRAIAKLLTRTCAPQRLEHYVQAASRYHRQTLVAPIMTP
jgi:hypothetical protein